jgi:hypothetical protein
VRLQLVDDCLLIVRHVSFVTFSCHNEFPKKSVGTYYEVAAADVIDHSEFIGVCRAIPEAR